MSDDLAAAAIAACLFTPAATDHIWWTVLLVDPALHDTPSQHRLIGHYASEFEAVDAADQLIDELNCCLVPGEAPFIARPLGIELASPATRTPATRTPLLRPASPRDSPDLTSAGGTK